MFAKKTLWGVLLLILIGLTIILFFIEFKKNNIQQEKVNYISVQTTKAVSENVPIDVNSIGSLSAINSISVTSQIYGQVIKVLFKDGAFVVKGQSLIQIDDSIYQAQLSGDEANLELSKLKFARMNKLVKSGMVSKQAYDEAFANLKGQEAKVKVDKVKLDKTLITAPFSGVLGAKKISVGDYIQPGQDLVKLTDIKHLKVEYSVSENYLAKLKLGQKVFISTQSYPEKIFEGNVEYISKTVDPDDRTINMYAIILNRSNTLSPGLFVRVKHLLGSALSSTVVPSISLMATIDGPILYKIVNNKALLMPVKLGYRTNSWVQITQGVVPGDEVVIDGQEKLSNGSVVKIIKKKV